MNRDKWMSIGKGALIALGGFAVTFLANDVIPQIDQSNTSGMLAVAIISILINVIRKSIQPSSQ